MWGFSFVAIEIALREATPQQLVSLRFLPTILIFGPVIVVKLIRDKKRIAWKDLGYLTFTGFFAVIVYNFSLNTGQTYLPASLASIVIALNPASIAIIASYWLKEKSSKATWLGLVIGLTGILVVILGRNGTPEIQLRNLIGVGITLFAPISWGIFTTGMRLESPKYGALFATTVAITIGSIPLLFTINRDLINVVSNASSELIISSLFLTLGCTVYGFVAWSIVLKRIEAAKVGALIYFVPIVATTGSIWLLKEKIDLPLILGGIVVLLGVSIATGRIRLPKKRIPSELQKEKILK
jgi:drug/metabolite transporter (DMT)-like permease